jgi:hypothetical protein
MLDTKATAIVQYLFANRGRMIGMASLNARLIPLHCHKAGIPNADARGKLTSHRARSTIASMLCNAKEPMTLLELQQWLGHRWPPPTGSRRALARSTALAVLVGRCQIRQRGGATRQASIGRRDNLAGTDLVANAAGLSRT